MSAAEKQRLLNLLQDSNKALLESVLKSDLAIVRHADSGWRGREMLSHIGAWDREIAKSLQAYASGETYIMDELEEDTFNLEAAAAQSSLSTTEVIADWKLARKELAQALDMLPAEKFLDEFVYPWADEQGTVATLITYFYDHDIEHKVEFDNALKDAA